MAIESLSCCFVLSDRAQRAPERGNWRQLLPKKLPKEGRARMFGPTSLLGILGPIASRDGR